MDLLENLYNIENFGIYLFIAIGILIILFLVILFFGKKDEKKRKLEAQNVEHENPKEESISEDTTNQNIPEPVLAPEPLNAEMSQEAPTLGTVEPETEMPFKEMEEPVQPIEIPEPVLEKSAVPDLASVALSQIEEEQKENIPVEPKQEERVEEPKIEKEFDFDALADAINKELASIEKTEEPAPVPVLQKEEERPLQYSVVEETKPALKPFIEPDVQTPPVEMPKPEKKVMPTVFSSVYVNREKEEPIVMPKKEEIPEPVAPKIELPKTIDLPKRNNE